MDKPEQKTQFLILTIMGTPRTQVRHSGMFIPQIKPLIKHQVSWN